MCQFKSAILLKDRVYVPDHDHHSNMLEELGINDDYLNASKTFVRVELSPVDGNVNSDPFGWKMKVDQDILPDWYQPGVDDQRVKEAIAEWCKVHVLKEGTHEVNEGVWYAYGSSTVMAYGSSTVMASGSSTVRAYESSTVMASDSSTVMAYESSTVMASGSSTVMAYESSTVEASGSSKVEAYGSSTVKAYGRSTVKAYGSSTVMAYGSSTVKAYGSSTVMASGSSTVKAYGSSTVILPKYFQTKNEIILKGNSICVNHKTNTIRSAIKWKQEE